MREIKIRSNLTLSPQTRDWLSTTGNASRAVDLLVELALLRGWSLHDIISELEDLQQEANGMLQLPLNIATQ